jgi:uncharacterized protein (TIGR02145 family)
MKKNLAGLFIIISSLLLSLSVNCTKDGAPSGLDVSTVTDIDGNEYKTVTIGSQVWMAENLKVLRYRNGTAIPLVSDSAEWASRTSDAYCLFDNNSASTPIYGLLYNWYAVNSAAGLCPQGWHVPTAEEWQTTVTLLGGDSTAGGKMKETGTTHWKEPNTGATDESGFKALPGGTRVSNGRFYSQGDNGYFWSSTASGADSALYRVMLYDGTQARRLAREKNMGNSCRCIKD